MREIKKTLEDLPSTLRDSILGSIVHGHKDFKPVNAALDREALECARENRRYGQYYRGRVNSRLSLDRYCEIIELLQLEAAIYDAIEAHAEAAIAREDKILRERAHWQAFVNSRRKEKANSGNKKSFLKLLLTGQLFG